MKSDIWIMLVAMFFGCLVSTYHGYSYGVIIGMKKGIYKLHKGEYICKTIEFTGGIECKENKDG